jgi:hypothetical protein
VGVKMGYSLAAQKKMMFYPTSEFETHRLLGVLCKLSIDFYNKQYIKKMLGEDEYRKLYELSFDTRVDIEHILFNYFLERGDYDSIKSCIKMQMSTNTNNMAVIGDLFAGESRWIDSFFEIMNRDSLSGEYLAVANELDEDRYLQFKDKKHIKYKYNSSFEELQLPKQSISLMLYNPPYGDTNGVRNVRHYLKMMLDKDFLSPYANMVFVIREDDALDILDILCENFQVNKRSVYKTDPEEYKKYKQIIFVAQKLTNPIDVTSSYGMAHYQYEYNDLKKVFQSVSEFNLTNYNVHNTLMYVNVNIYELMENFRYVKENKNYLSKMDGAWRWVQEISALKDLGKSRIEMPKNPKIGELAMLMSSGYINGELSLNNGNAKHVVVGGTRVMSKEEITVEKGEDGKKVTIFECSLQFGGQNENKTTWRC